MDYIKGPGWQVRGSWKGSLGNGGVLGSLVSGISLLWRKRVEDWSVWAGVEDSNSAGVLAGCGEYIPGMWMDFHHMS